MNKDNDQCVGLNINSQIPDMVPEWLTELKRQMAARQPSRAVAAKTDSLSRLREQVFGTREWTKTDFEQHTGIELLALAHYGITELFKAWVLSKTPGASSEKAGEVIAIDGWIGRLAAALETNLALSAGDGLALIRLNQKSSLSQCWWQTEWLKPDCSSLRWDCNWWPLAAQCGQADQPPAMFTATDEFDYKLSKKVNDVFFENVGGKETTPYAGTWVNVDGDSFQATMQTAWYWAYHHDFGGHSALELLALAYEAIGQQFGAWMWISDPGMFSGNCIGWRDYSEVDAWDDVIEKICEALRDRLMVSEDQTTDFVLDYYGDEIAGRQAFITLLASGCYEVLRDRCGWHKNIDWDRAMRDAKGYEPDRHYPGRFFKLPDNDVDGGGTCPADDDDDGAELGIVDTGECESDLFEIARSYYEHLAEEYRIASAAIGRVGKPVSDPVECDLSDAEFLAELNRIGRA